MGEPKREIIGVGLSTLDILIRLDKMPSWDCFGGYTDLAIQGGGMVGTAMVAVSRLGCPCGYVGAAGNDELGQQKVESFKKYGVDVRHMMICGEPEQSVMLCYVHAETGERQFVSRKGGWSDSFDPDRLDRSYFDDAKFLHLDGFHSRAGLRAAQWVHESGGKVVLDAGATRPSHAVGEKMREVVAHTDYLVCGAGFSQALTGEMDIEKAVRKAVDYGPPVVVQTEGEKGSFGIAAGEYFHTPAFVVDVIDTTGAGDVFHGGFLVGLLQGWDLHSVVLFSTAVSALKCTKLGGRAGIPSRPEVFEFLKGRGVSPFWE